MHMRNTVISFIVCSTMLLGVAFMSPESTAQAQGGSAPAQTGALFQPSTQCMTCHNGVMTPGGEDVSFGTLWRASMMAHAARDPYWHAGVRREVMDHPRAQAAIENECSRCHMPMAHVQQHALGRQQTIFQNLPAAGAAADPLAVEGVSCALCHQIRTDALGSKSSFTGGFVIDTGTPLEKRQMFGPYEVDPGRTAVMRSATGLLPTQAMHVQQSEVCATCHTLYTHALNAAGEASSEFPEQMPYQEWLHSEFRTTQSCQACHMPVVAQPTPITSVLGEPREGLSRHDFRGANFLMLGVLNRFRTALGVVARPAEMDAAIARTKSFLQSNTATVGIERTEIARGRLEVDVAVRNLAGHKLPTAYPSRRAWLRVTVHDRQGRLVFSSGAVEPTGAIVGNDNDQDGARFEPHYREIQSADQVQIYEAITGTQNRAVTTGLLSAVSYLKDNRILPRGFDKRTAPGDVAVHGEAFADPDFGAGEDRVRYLIDVDGAPGPFAIEVQLWYQSIAYRWAENLRVYRAVEPQRFVSYYDQMAPESAIMLTRAASTAQP
jgi:Cytochrome c554 and c-prime